MAIRVMLVEEGPAKRFKDVRCTEFPQLVGQLLGKGVQFAPASGGRSCIPAASRPLVACRPADGP